MVRADRSIAGRRAWSGMRARASQSRQKRTEASTCAVASSASAGDARPSAQDSAQYAVSPVDSTWRARAEPPSMPIIMSVLSRKTGPSASAASARCPSASARAQVASTRP